MYHTAFISLGSNLDKPQQHVRSAIKELNCTEHSKLTAKSSLYQSTAVGPKGQDDYVNAVIKLKTYLSPNELLSFLHNLEDKHKRVRTTHWGSRTLDLDLLLYDAQVINTKRLTVPHPYLSQRNFVLYPLLEIAPELTSPHGQMLAHFVAAKNTDGLIKLKST